MEAVVSELEKDRRLREAFTSARFPPLEAFLEQGGVTVMLELVQVRGP